MSKRKLVDGTRTRAGRTRSTMADVAKLAGVSLMTVSRAINGKDLVSDHTRQKVARAVAALNFTPNCEARSVAGYKPIRIGFLYSNLSGAYLNEFLVGLLNRSGLNNVQILVEKCEAGTEGHAQARSLIQRGLDGMILPPPLGDSESVVAQINACGIPVVAVACGLSARALGTVGIDDEMAAYDMTRHLISLGHRRIGFVGGDASQPASARRLAGYRKAIRELNVDASPDLVARGWFTYRSGLDAAELLLALPERPTAIFASNDDMAAAVIAVAQRAGLDVPGDLTVTGFDDTELATRVWPELTTIRQPIADMTREAVEMLLRRIRAQRTGEPSMPEHVRLRWALIRRQSDAVPRLRPPSAVRLALASHAREQRSTGDIIWQRHSHIGPEARSSANSRVTRKEIKPVR